MNFVYVIFMYCYSYYQMTISISYYVMDLWNVNKWVEYEYEYGDVNTVLNCLVQYKHTPENDFLLPVS
jgi:hypothetical protein